MAERKTAYDLKIALPALFGAAACLGMTTTLAKRAGDLSLPPIGFLFWSLVGGTLILFAVAAWRGELPKAGTRRIEYYLIAGLVTAAGANIVFFAAIPIVGAAYVSLILSLPPLLTYVGALSLRMERFDAMRFAGVIAALAGVCWLAVGELQNPDVPAFWALLALAGPVLLSIGNLYRTLRWPAGDSPISLTVGMTSAALLFIAAAGLLVPRFDLRIATDGSTLLLVAMQAAFFAVQFLLLFVLQKRGGPVLLSLLGGVATLVAIPAAILFLDESLPDNITFAALGIAVGVVLVAKRSGR